MSNTAIKVTYKSNEAAALKERFEYAAKILPALEYKVDGSSISASVQNTTFISLMGMLQTYCNKAKTSVEVENSQGQKLSFSAIGKFNFRELESKVVPLMS